MQTVYNTGNQMNNFIQADTTVTAYVNSATPEEKVNVMVYGPTKMKLYVINVSEDGVPHLRLSGSPDAQNNVYTFVMAAGIDENCSIVSMGIAFRYGKAAAFQPENTLVTINNKMLTSKFAATPESGYYIVNVRGFSRYNWAARGYVTYYDSYGTLRTVYTEQLNITG